MGLLSGNVTDKIHQVWVQRKFDEGRGALPTEIGGGGAPIGRSCKDNCARWLLTRGNLGKKTSGVLRDKLGVSQFSEEQGQAPKETTRWLRTDKSPNKQRSQTFWNVYLGLCSTQALRVAVSVQCAAHQKTILKPNKLA